MLFPKPKSSYRLARENALATQVVNGENRRQADAIFTLFQNIGNHRGRPVVCMHDIERRARERALANEIDDGQDKQAHATCSRRVPLDDPTDVPRPRRKPFGIEENEVDT